jgi:hypothetical protein
MVLFFKWLNDENIYPCKILYYHLIVDEELIYVDNYDEDYHYYGDDETNQASMAKRSTLSDKNEDGCFTESLGTGIYKNNTLIF